MDLTCIPGRDSHREGFLFVDAIRQYKKLLCIANDPDTSKVIREILTNSFGKEVVEVIETNTSQEGLEIYQRLKPEIVLCDIQMPDKNGFEICQEIQAEKTGSSIILMFEQDDREDNALLKKMGSL